MGEPMEIDAAQGRFGRGDKPGPRIGPMRGPDGHLTPQEQDRRRRLGLCYFCAGENHMAINCPQKTQGRGTAPYPSNNPFRRPQVATAEAIPQTPKNLTIEERTMQIAEMLSGSNEENEKIKEMLLEKGFH